MAATTGLLTAVGPGDPFRLDFNSIQFNASLWGTFLGTVRLARSFDNGATFLPLTALGTAINFTGPCTETFEEYEDGIIYRWECTSYTSGTINYRISQ
ncbi:hypothetical protein BH11PSE5_BH11PSE5_20700 [soil metagenome]